MVKFISIIPLLTLAPSLASASLLHRESQTSKNNHSNEEEVTSSPNDHRVMMAKALSKMYRQLSTQHGDRKMINRKLQVGIDEDCLEWFPSFGFDPFMGSIEAIEDVIVDGSGCSTDENGDLECDFMESNVSETAADYQQECDNVDGEISSFNFERTNCGDGELHLNDVVVKNLPLCLGETCPVGFLLETGENSLYENCDVNLSEVGGYDDDITNMLGSSECFSDVIDLASELEGQFIFPFVEEPDCIGWENTIRCKADEELVEEQKETCDEVGGAFFLSKYSRKDSCFDENDVVLYNVPTCMGKSCADKDGFLTFVEELINGDEEDCDQTSLSVDNGEDMDDPFGLGSLECAYFFHNVLDSEAFLGIFDDEDGLPGDCNDVEDGALTCDLSMLIPTSTAMCEELDGETSILTATETCADGSRTVLNNMPACRGKGCDLDLMTEWMEVNYEEGLNGCPKTFKKAKKVKAPKGPKGPKGPKTLKSPKKAPKA